jgi:predicted RNA-binding protein Jag
VHDLALERRHRVEAGAFERKVVHDAVATVAGVHSESEGEEPQRRVIIFPKP